MQKILDFNSLDQMQNILYCTLEMQNPLDFSGHGGHGSCTTPHLTASLCQVGRTGGLFAWRIRQCQSSVGANGGGNMGHQRER
jgi:hypothetical protein